MNSSIARKSPVFKLFVCCRCVPPNTGVYVDSTFTAYYPAVATFRKRCYAGSHLSESFFLRHVRKGRKGTVDTDGCRDDLLLADDRLCGRTVPFLAPLPQQY